MRNAAEQRFYDRNVWGAVARLSSAILTSEAPQYQLNETQRDYIRQVHKLLDRILLAGGDPSLTLAFLPQGEDPDSFGNLYQQTQQALLEVASRDEMDLLERIRGYKGVIDDLVECKVVEDKMPTEIAEFLSRFDYLLREAVLKDRVFV